MRSGESTGIWQLIPQQRHFTIPDLNTENFNAYMAHMRSEHYMAHVRSVESQLRAIFSGVSMADIRFPITNPSGFTVDELPQRLTLPELPTISYDEAMRMLESFSQRYGYLTEPVVGAMSDHEHAEIREQLGLDPIPQSDLDAGYDTSDDEAGREWSRKMFRPELDHRKDDGWSNGAHP